MTIIKSHCECQDKNILKKNDERVIMEHDYVKDYTI